MGDFFRGAAIFARALGLAWGRARLRNLILAPTLLVVLGTLGGARPLYHALDRVAHDRLHVHAGWLGALLSVGVFLLAMVLLYLVFIIGTALLLAPLGGTLAERTEAELGRPAPPAVPLSQTIKEALLGLAHTLLAAALFVLTLVPLVVLNWLVPLLAPLVAIQTALFLAYDGLDPTLSRGGRRFADKWRFLRAHFGYCVGFGLAAALFLAIPILNLFATPVVAIGGTMLFHAIIDAEPAAQPAQGRPQP